MFWVTGSCILLIVITVIGITLLQNRLAQILSISSGHIDKLAQGDLQDRFGLHSRFAEVLSP